MSDLQISERPELRRPLLIAAFSGWNDAGEAASSAVRFLQRRWRSEIFARIDPEEYYDFTQARPMVKLSRGERVLEWPENTFAAQALEGHDRDLILLRGVEPHLHWRQYTEQVLDLCRQFNVSGVLTLGALLAEVSHARPVPVTGSSGDEELAALLDIGQRRGSGYEGPTGIVGVLNQAIREAGIPTASMWANMPFYVQRTPNPKGSLALLERLTGALGLDVTLHDLEVFAARFEAQVASDIEGNPEIAEYARRVEEQAAEQDDEEPTRMEDLPDAQSMVDELEQFLRQQRDPDDD